MTSYGMEHPLGQLQSTVLAVLPLSFLCTWYIMGSQHSSGTKSKTQLLEGKFTLSWPKPGQTARKKKVAVLLDVAGGSALGQQDLMWGLVLLLVPPYPWA